MKCPIYPTKFRLNRCYKGCSGRINLWKVMTNQRGSCGGNGNDPAKPLSQPKLGIEWTALEYPEFLNVVASFGINLVRLRYGWTNSSTGVQQTKPWNSINEHNQVYYDLTKQYVERARKLGIWVHINMFKTQSGFMIPGFSPEEYCDGAWQQLYAPANYHLLQARAHKLIQTIGHPDNVILELFCEPESRSVNPAQVREAHKYLRSVLKHELGWNPERISTNGGEREFNERAEAGEYYSFHWTDKSKFQGLVNLLKTKNCKAIFSTDGKDEWNSDVLCAERDEAHRVGAIYAWWNRRWSDSNEWNSEILRRLGG